MVSNANTRSSQGSSHTVIPTELPKHAAQVLGQALHHSQINKGIEWVLDHMSDEEDPTQLVETYLERYEQQIMRLKGDELHDCVPVFRAALLSKNLAALPHYRMRFADKAYNYVFLDTWLKKKLLATLLGITIGDVARKIFLSGRTPPTYLEQELNRLLPMTCLKGMPH